MADLLTHALTTVLVGRAVRLEGVALAWFLSGAFLPDFVSRAPTVLLGRLIGPLIPPGDYSPLVFGLQSLHTPFLFALVAAAAVLALPERLLRPLPRSRAWLLLTLGALLHIALDALQIRFSMPAPIFFPLTLWGPDIGFLGTEDSMLSWPVLIPLVAGLEWRRHAERTKAAPSSGPPSISSDATRSVGQRYEE